MSSFGDFYRVYLTSHSLKSLLIPSTPLMPGTTITLRNFKGHCWQMDVVKRGNKMYFHKGWIKFINENFVRDGNILVFSYVGNFMYDVKVFGVNACESVEVEEIHQEEEEEEEEEENEENVVNHSNPFFVAKTTSTRRKNELYVPSHVTKDYNLRLEHGEKVTFIDANGVWKSIGKVVKWKDQRTCIKGWTSVCNLNRIKQKHATCICEFLLEEEQEDENSKKIKFIKVHVMESPRQNEAENGRETGVQMKPRLK